MLRKRICVIVILFILGTTNLFAQNVAIGLRFEPCFFVDGHNSNDIWAHKLKDGSGIFLESFAITSSYQIANNFSSSLRIGYLGTRTQGDHGFNGYEVSSYLSYGRKSNGLIPMIGVVIHLNSGTDTWGVLVKRKTILLASIGFETELFRHIIIGSLFQLPISNSEFNTVSTNIPHNTYVRYIVKLVIGYEIDL